MFVVRIEMKVRAEEQSALRALAQTDGLRARKQPGCVDYSFCEDVAEPFRVLLYEEWATREQFEAYKASPVFSEMGSKLRPMLSEPPKSAYYDSDDVYASCALRQAPPNAEAAPGGG